MNGEIVERTVSFFEGNGTINNHHDSFLCFIIFMKQKNSPQKSERTNRRLWTGQLTHWKLACLVKNIDPEKLLCPVNVGFKKPEVEELKDSLKNNRKYTGPVKLTAPEEILTGENLKETEYRKGDEFMDGLEVKNLDGGLLEKVEKEQGKE